MPCGLFRWANEWERRLLREGAEKEEKRLQRWNEHGPTWWLMRTVAPMVVLMSLAQYPTVRDHRTDQRVDSLLSHDGVVADGKAIEFSVHFGWGALIYTDRVKVAFKTSDGRKVETWLPHEIPVKRDQYVCAISVLTPPSPALSTIRLPERADGWPWPGST